MDTAAAAEIANIEIALVERLRADRIRIPPYPAVVAKLQAALGNELAGVPEIAAIVGTDSVLSAALLRRASTAVQIGGSATTIEAAILRIGGMELIELALAASVGAAATAAGPLSGLRRDTWRCSLLSARLCQLLAPRRRIPPDVAFIAGLLHDFGSVVVVSALEDCANRRRLAVLKDEAWRDLVARYHLEFGMVVAARWNLPDAISQVIARHHNPGAERSGGLVGLVATVDHVIAILERAPEAGIAALLAVPGLDDRDRLQIGVGIGRSSRLLDTLEHSMPAPATIATAPTAIASSLPPDAGWPVDVEITVKGERLRVTTVWPDRFAFRGGSAMQANWLADIVLHTEPTPLVMLANVRECVHDPVRHDYVSIAQPYALGGPQKDAWHHLVEFARHAAAVDEPHWVERAATNTVRNAPEDAIASSR